MISVRGLATFIVLGLAPTQGGDDERPAVAVALRFDAEAAAACLEDARAAMANGEVAYGAMSRWIAEPLSSSIDELRDEVGGALLAHDGPFAAFEGAWCGEWGTMPVRQLWLSTTERAQLVLVVDGDVEKSAINYESDDGTLCGIVMDGEVERLHLGRGLASDGIEWATPERNYDERVVRNGGALRYEIRETVPGHRKHGGTSADYHRYPSSSGPPVCEAPNAAPDVG